MKFDTSSCILKPMNEEAAKIIKEWEYPKPYDVYSFKGKKNGYLLDEKTWGIEQFFLVCDNEIIGQVACQYEKEDLWVGWSLSPTFCGKGKGHLFIGKCIEEISRIKQHNGALLLRVAASNERAIKCYMKVGFIFEDKILDEVAGTNNPEDFWIMKLPVQRGEK